MTSLNNSALVCKFRKQPSANCSGVCARVTGRMEIGSFHLHKRERFRPHTRVERVRWNLVSVCEAGLHRTFLRTGFWIIKIVFKKASKQERGGEKRIKRSVEKDGGGVCGADLSPEPPHIHTHAPHPTPGHFHILKCAPSTSIFPELSCVQRKARM